VTQVESDEFGPKLSRKAENDAVLLIGPHKCENKLLLKESFLFWKRRVWEQKA